MPPITAPAINPPARPGPNPPRASAGAGLATAPTPRVATVASIKAAFLIRFTPLDCLLTIAAFESCSKRAFGARFRKFNVDEGLFRLLSKRTLHHEMDKRLKGILGLAASKLGSYRLFNPPEAAAAVVQFVPMLELVSMRIFIRR
jgi:hypothetical protein